MKLIPAFLLLASLLTSSLLQAQALDPAAAGKINDAAAKEGLSGLTVLWISDLADEKLWAFPNAKSDGKGKSELLPAEGDLPFTKFRRLTLKSATDANWSHKVSLKVPQTFQPGELAYVVFWAKAGDSVSNGLPLNVQVTSRPDIKLVKADNFRVDLSDTWQFYSIETSILSDVASNILDIAILVGGEARVLDIAGVAVLR